jgi:CCR4-NOT transcriptional regulation complex NOT5 subunit
MSADTNLCSCFKCSTCNTTLNVGNYHVVEDKLLCKTHYQQSFAHKAPSADVKSTTPRGTTPAPSTAAVDTKKQEEEQKKKAEEEKKKQDAAKQQQSATKPAVTATPAATKPAVTATKPAATATPVATKPVVTATPATTKPAATSTPVKPAVTPSASSATKPDDSKALESLKQFSAALDKLEHALTAVERRL